MNMELMFFFKFYLHTFIAFEETLVIKRCATTEVSEMSKENHFKLLYPQAGETK